LQISKPLLLTSNCPRLFSTYRHIGINECKLAEYFIISDILSALALDQRIIQQVRHSDDSV
jgi:hypothetical protein